MITTSRCGYRGRTVCMTIREGYAPRHGNEWFPRNGEIGNPDSVGIPSAQPPHADRPLVSRAWLWAVAVAVIAFLFRLVPILRGGGLSGVGDYDDGVYYSAATALVHGLLPYQDFLLLHPPGMTLLLTPFAATAQLVGDSNGFVLARLAWMLLGAANAMLIWKILRPIGPVAALFGGLGYAVLYPAVYIEQSTFLEGPATTALLIAMLLLQPVTQDHSLPGGRALAAGALLGLATTIKIWGVITLVIVLGWLLLLSRFRAALQVMIASAASVTVICLPFFIAAPTAMWNQVVRDQLFRRRRLGITNIDRLQEIAGLGITERFLPPAVIVAAVIALLGAAMLAWTYREAQLAVLLMIGLGTFLLITPVWLVHFAGLTAAPVAITIGAAIGRLTELARAGPARIVIVGTFAGALIVYASGWAAITHNRPFPDHFRAFIAATPGCVTSDDPISLVVTDSLSRNLRRGCRFIADLGGHHHDFAAASGRAVSRHRNPAYQRFALDYLRAGSVTILVRYGFSEKTTAVLEQWPLLAHSEVYQVRQPVEPGRPEGTR
jgi:alpha-1,2-mannosyltransferase